MLISRISQLSGNPHTLDLDVTQEQLDRHKSGELAQDVFQNLNLDDREFLISGITSEEWKQAFG